MAEDSENALNVYLAEYNSLRAETMQRIETQTQSFNFLLISIGAAITAVISTYTATDHKFLPFIVLSIILSLPLVTCPLGLIFFDNEIMMHAIGTYLYHNRRPHIKLLTGDNDVLQSPLGFDYLPKSTAVVFPAVSRGRWLLFCVPTFPPLLIALLYFYVNSNSLRHNHQFMVIAVILWVTDTIFCWPLLKSILWVRENKKLQDWRAGQEKLDANQHP